MENRLRVILIVKILFVLIRIVEGNLRSSESASLIPDPLIPLPLILDFL